MSQKLNVRVIAVPAVYYLCWCLQQFPGNCLDKKGVTKKKQKQHINFWVFLTSS